jgi:uncharacterized glyoxalase superfamily protein PhnB
MAIPFRNLTPVASVRDVTASTAFYETLGFEAGNTFTPDGADTPTWVYLKSAGAELMLSHVTDPVIADQQAVLFYLYCDDVDAKHAELAAAGIAVGTITKPFYNPRGEFRATDPDGYVLMITHT